MKGHIKYLLLWVITFATGYLIGFYDKLETLCK